MLILKSTHLEEHMIVQCTVNSAHRCIGCTAARASCSGASSRPSLLPSTKCTAMAPAHKVSALSVSTFGTCMRPSHRNDRRRHCRAERASCGGASCMLCLWHDTRCTPGAPAHEHGGREWLHKSVYSIRIRSQFGSALPYARRHVGVACTLFTTRPARACEEAVCLALSQWCHLLQAQGCMQVSRACCAACPVACGCLPCSP